MAQQANADDGEPTYKQSQHVAAIIERSVSGVTADVAREMIRVDFGETRHLPEQVAQIARAEGYTFHKVLGSTAEFLPAGHHRTEGDR
jgi:hypothetical protein